MRKVNPASTLRPLCFVALAVVLAGCPPMARNNPFDPESDPGKVSRPYFSVSEGTYTTVQQVTISCNTPGATIYYTTDSAPPSAASTQYTGAITVAASMTIEAVATGTGLQDSDIVTLVLVINLPAAAPPAPSRLTATAGDGTVTLAWEAVSGANHHDVYYRAGTTAATTDATVGPFTTGTATITGLTNGTQHAFVVTATNAVGEGAPCDPVTATPVAPIPADTTPPSEVTNMAVGDGDGALTVTWTDPTSSDFDHVELTWTPGGTTPVTVAKGVEAYNAAGLTNDTPYAFVARTVDPAGNKSAGVSTGGTPYGVVFVSPPGNDGNAGLNPTHAKSTIQAGINAAVVQSRTGVRVATGTYQVTGTGDGAINMASGVSLYGGYSSDFAQRDWTTHVTTITDTRTTYNGAAAAVLLDSVAGCTVEGFTINAAACTGSSSSPVGVWIRGTKSANLVRNNRVYGGSTPAGGTQWAVLCEGSADLSTVVERNYIDAEGPGGTLIALWASTSVTVRLNTLIGGSGAAYAARTVYAAGGSPRFYNNLIASGYSTSENDSVFCSGGADMTPVFMNNTIVAGGSTGRAVCVFLMYNSSVSLDNNLLILTGPTTDGHCIWLHDGAGYAETLGTFRNNRLYKTATTNLFYAWPNGELAEADLNNTTKTWATVASDNFVGDPSLMSLGGTDGNFNTPADNDWHLSGTSPTSVTQGGLDLSSFFTTDYDGTTRTAPWSIGAYEK